MKLLKSINDKDLESGFKTREAARAVLFDDSNLVPILFVSKHNYHKLPGGGIEKGEDKTMALKREVLEEVGSTIEVGDEIGKVIECRYQFNLKQISYCYFGKVVSKGESNLEKGEIEDGFELIWISLNEVIKKFKNDTPKNYEGKFIQLRDLAFLLEAKNLIDSKL